MEKIKDRNEHQKQNLLKNQKLNTRKKYSQTPQHTETPPSPQRVSRLFLWHWKCYYTSSQKLSRPCVVCPYPLFFLVRTERLYENLELKEKTLKSNL